MADDPAAARRAIRLVRLAGTAVLALFVAGLLFSPRAAVRANLPGFSNPVVGLELVGTPAEALDILGHPGDPGRPDMIRRMRLVTWLDFLFLLAYPAFHAAVALLLHARGRIGATTVRVVVALAVAMSLGDAVENVQILALCDTVDPAVMAGPLGWLRAATVFKWGAIFVASAVLAAGVRRERGWWRWTTPLFALGALSGALGAAHPPAVEWSLAPLGLAWLATYARAWAAFES
jgi:hypothetical protein